MVSATLANQQIHDFQRERIRSEYERERGVSSSEGDLNRGNKNFNFRADNNIVQKVEAEIISDLKKKDPTSGQNLATVLKETKPYPSYMATFKSLGLDTENDYADVFTGYLLGMWRIANKMASNPTKNQILSVRNQVVNTLDVSNLNDRERQANAAYLVYDLIFANEAYERSRKAKNSATIQEVSDNMQHRFLRVNNLNLRNMIITKNGLVPR